MDYSNQPRSPEEMFDALYELPTNGSEYSLVQGELYKHLTRDVRASETDALDVARKLNNGKIGEAEEQVEELLEE